MEDRVVNFSVQPADTEGKSNITKIKEYSKETGITFSFLMLKAAALLVKELKL